MMADVPGPNERVLERTGFTRRRLLRDAMTIVGAVAAGVVPHQAFARQRGNAGPGGAPVDNTLALAQAVNRMRYEDLPGRAIERAKMILGPADAGYRIR